MIGNVDGSVHIWRGERQCRLLGLKNEIESSAVLIDSDEACSDSSDSTVIDSDVAVTSKSVTSSDDELGDYSFIDVGNDDGDGEKPNPGGLQGYQKVKIQVLVSLMINMTWKKEKTSFI